VLAQLRSLADAMFDEMTTGVTSTERERMHAALAVLHANLTLDETRKAANG
jgi:hypothetical protein